MAGRARFRTLRVGNSACEAQGAAEETQQPFFVAAYQCAGCEWCPWTSRGNHGWTFLTGVWCDLGLPGCATGCHSAAVDDPACDRNRDMLPFFTDVTPADLIRSVSLVTMALALFTTTLVLSVRRA
jgi:hypothetical protein